MASRRTCAPMPPGCDRAEDPRSRRSRYRTVGSVAHAERARSRSGHTHEPRPRAWCRRCARRNAARSTVRRNQGMGAGSRLRPLFAHCPNENAALQDAQPKVGVEQRAHGGEHGEHSDDQLGHVICFGRVPERSGEAVVVTFTMGSDEAGGSVRRRRSPIRIDLPDSAVLLAARQ